MDSIYKNCRKYYHSLCKTIIAENIKLVDANIKERPENEEETILKQKAIFPSIDPDPKTGFLTKTQRNLFTKDDPILRFMPTVKSKLPASINWFEGTVIGGKTCSEKDTIDNLFLAYCSNNGMLNDGNAYLNRPLETIKKYQMKDLFCNVCLLFNCGIHPINPGLSAKYNEPSNCICHLNISNTIVKHDSKEKILLSNKKHLLCSFLKGCIVKKLFRITEGLKIKCDDYVKLNLPVQTIGLSKRQIIPMEYYKPCKHVGPCWKSNCSRVKNGTSCEINCFCTNCKNMKFCECQGPCNENCICKINLRECTELCGHLCNNMKTQICKPKKALVFKSKFHGFGLFSDEDIIKKDEFVMEYTGEVITDKEAERRGNFYEMNNCSYLFNLVNYGSECLYSIDAFELGNESRYINHSGESPNLNSNVLLINGVSRITFTAKRDIYMGEEFLFDYKFTLEQQKKHGMAN